MKVSSAFHPKRLPPSDTILMNEPDTLGALSIPATVLVQDKSGAVILGMLYAHHDPYWRSYLCSSLQQDAFPTPNASLHQLVSSNDEFFVI